jgi:hypothetical protein
MVWRHGDKHIWQLVSEKVKLGVHCVTKYLYRLIVAEMQGNLLASKKSIIIWLLICLTKPTLPFHPLEHTLLSTSDVESIKNIRMTNKEPVSNLCLQNWCQTKSLPTETVALSFIVYTGFSDWFFHHLAQPNKSCNVIKIFQQELSVWTI